MDWDSRRGFDTMESLGGGVSVTAFDCERWTLTGKLKTSMASVSATLMAVFLAGCFDAPRQEEACDGFDASTDTAVGGEVGTPIPIPVADAAEPTPVREASEAESLTDAIVNGDADAGALVWLPWLGWGRTIDLLDLLATGGLGDSLEPASDNPGSFTHLELLCLDQGLQPSYCRSRYGGP